MVERRLMKSLLYLWIAVTVFIGLWMAQPWNGQAPYDAAWGYLLLAGFLAWACAPYGWLIRRAGQTASRPVRVLRWVTVLVLGLGGCALLVDAAFVHPDAQSALVLLVLPVYQWILIGLSEVLAWLLARNPASR